MNAAGAVSWRPWSVSLAGADPALPVGVFTRLREELRVASRSQLSRNAMWFTSLSGVERVMVVVQTVLISRALGITEYGHYGLLFGTIGFVASITGLQMGLTATVYVSRYRAGEPAKAAAVIAVVNRFAWISAVTFVAVTAPFSRVIAEELVASGQYETAILLAIMLVAWTILSGVQDGVAQGFEIFSAIAKTKIVVTLLVLGSIYPAAMAFGLNGALGAILGGLVLKYLVLRHIIWSCRVEAGIPERGEGVSFRALIGDFVLPSMLVSLLIGLVTWLGQVMLSRQESGFDEVAIVTTGLQWRGPVLLLAASLGGVAVPAFSRLFGAGDVGRTRRLRRLLALVNFSMAAVVAVVVTLASGLIMRAYGEGFPAGRLAFCFIVISTVFTVVANVYVHELVGQGRMWRQFWLHCPFLITLSLGFALLVPRYHALGYGLALLIGSIVFLGQFVIADLVATRPGRQSPEES